MTNHTPGPWIVAFEYGSPIIVAVNDPFKDEQVEGVDFMPYPIVDGAGIGGDSRPNAVRWTTIDNAYLISAAPDLLEVVNNAPFLSKYHTTLGFDLEGFIVEYDAWRTKARTAIAKASKV